VVVSAVAAAIVVVTAVAAAAVAAVAAGQCRVLAARNSRDAGAVTAVQSRGTLPTHVLGPCTCFYMDLEMY